MLSRQTIVLLVMLIALGGFVYFTEIRGNSQAASATPGAQERVFGSLAVTDVKSLDVQQSGSDVKLNRQSNGEWSLVQPSAQYTDTSRVSGAVSDLLAATKLRDVPLANVDLHQYGLDAPWLTATLTTTSGSQVLVVGNASVDGSSRYAQIKGSSSGFLLSVGTTDSLSGLVKQPPIATPTALATPVPTLAPLPSPSGTSTP